MRIFPALLAATAIAAVAAPAAHADDMQLSTILFGRNYNDGVMAVEITPGGADDRPSIPFARYPFPADMRAAQSAVSQDPELIAAIERRNIALHNVLWVQTAANGGRIIYYR
ncbi:hypothetical protein [Ciceribacter sp. L1K22]|uniref:hypothetical protein n=1 Tax=Ciceribacter sp. L1K22 TaxID=2820275 RepID=UPI001ABEDC9C|nr:hypothetical protein [Ciceribacter sp. L1K22]MBO3758690.1 hypothetical protein [Ciceribacter sp. L1K22]